jgi:hypothetical protein
MIVTKLIGGLGNQMFQYAAGLQLSHRLGAELKLDISNFDSEGVTRRRYELSIFNISAGIASPDDISKTKIRPVGLLCNYPRIVSLLEKISGKVHLIEGKNDVMNIKDENGKDIYLEGVWNSYKYLSGVEDLIRKELSFKTKPSDRNSDILREIKTSNSVSVHVRRGDYVNNPKVAKVYTICSLDYYKKATIQIEKRFGNARYYFFSDDPGWVKENFKNTKNVNIVDWNVGERSCEDLRLMIACKHNIIANSTFSWWGAWLNGNRNKIIVSPKRWFKDETKNVKELLPPEWIRI